MAGIANLPAEVMAQAVVQKLQSLGPDALLEGNQLRGELTLVVHPACIHHVCELLRGDADLQFNFLADLTAVDRYPVEPRFEVVYHLKSFATNQRLRLKARLTGDKPRIDSLYGLWPAADMLEREVFDMFGIHFNGHPNLRRLLMPDDWEGYPLRKDYPVEGNR
jgi:NADH-quinone oxidoreductase subunit C